MDFMDWDIIKGRGGAKVRIPARGAE